MLKFKIRKGEIKKNKDRFIVMFSGVRPDGKEVFLKECKNLNKIYKYFQDFNDGKERVEVYSVDGRFTLRFAIMHIRGSKVVNNWNGEVVIHKDAPNIRMITPAGILFEGRGFLNIPKEHSKHITFEIIKEINEITSIKKVIKLKEE